MTLTELIPVLKGPGRRRAVDEVDRLREDNVKLLTRQAAADDYFAILWNDVFICNRALVVKEALRQKAEVAASQMRMERDWALEEIERLNRELAPFRAARANANRVTVPPMHRDTTAIEDQATGPIDVRPLWAARDAGHLGPVTDPGHITT